MAINLADFEAGAKYRGDYDADLAALQARLERVQAAHIAHGQRSVILFEGWDAAGKGGIIKKLTAELDARSTIRGSAGKPGLTIIAIAPNAPSIWPRLPTCSSSPTRAGRRGR